MEQPSRRSRENKRQAIIVAWVFLGVIIVWGLSMGLISHSFRRMAYIVSMDRARRLAAEPYVRRAKSLGITCEQAFKDPKTVMKTVLWNVQEVGDGGFCDGRPSLRFAWTNPKDAAERLDRAQRSRFTAVAIVAAPPRGQEPLKLQYIGEWDETGGDR